jgi:uncharacterized protein (TIGR00288 family)
LSPWWLRPTAEGLNEEKREPSKPEVPTSADNAPQESIPEPSTSAAAVRPVSPPVSQGTEPAPEPAWRTEAEDAMATVATTAAAATTAADKTEAAGTWMTAEPAGMERAAPELYAFDETEETAEASDALAEYTEGLGEPAGEATGEEKEGEDRPEAKRKRSRRSRRRKNGRGTAATAETAEASEAADVDDDEEEDDEPFHEEPFEEPAPPPPPVRQTPSHRRSGHPAHTAPSSPAFPVALTPAPMQRSTRSESYVIPAGDLDAFTREIVISVPERQRSGSDERKIAMFCDLENIALGVRDSEISKFEIGLILERLLEKGKIIVKKAYADWERYSDYKRPFHEAAIELIDIPQKFYSGKNSADIKMVVDAMDLSYAKEHLDTFVIVSGDSDFSPLVSKLKENNKYVIGIGVKNSSSNLLIDNCDEFIYYEDVWRDSQKGPKLDGLNKKTAEAFSLMIESIQALIRENKDVLWGSMIKQTMQRKKPSFNEGYYGYSSFSELLEDAERKQILKLKKDQRSGTYIVTGFSKTEAPARR